jgi:hypothetical protein
LCPGLLSLPAQTLTVPFVPPGTIRFFRSFGQKAGLHPAGKAFPFYSASFKPGTPFTAPVCFPAEPNPKSREQVHSIPFIRLHFNLVKPFLFFFPPPD